MQPDWPSLWEREPGLRPNVADWETTGLSLEGDKLFYWANGQQHQLAPVLINAVCRDAAVRWLADGSNTQGVEVLTSSGHAIVKTPHIGRVKAPKVAGSDGRPTPWYPSLDEALFAACAAVLDARKCQ